LEGEITRPDFWEDPEKARQTLTEFNELKNSLSIGKELEQNLEDISALNELALSENDEHLGQEVAQEIKGLVERVEEIETQSLLSGEFDDHNAIVSIHPGAGGTESQDWAEMLLRMYLRWAERRNFKTEIKEITPGEEAGIKSATFTVSGKYAYGLLEAEKGVHRLVRISPFDASRRRHTSFASVDVIPVIEKEIEVIIDPKDLKIETYRASGPGGQHVNVTDSAVRITHLPTKTTAQCQSERSQLRNREMAMEILRARIFEKQRREREKELAALRGEKKEIAWGSQIRSYVFQPYTVVKDHRTGLETGDTQAVMDGEIDEFIREYLKKLKVRS